MKFIFLDIDGVLNCEEWYKSKEFSLLIKHSNYEYNKTQFSPICIENLNKLVYKTGAKVIISSSWRLGRGVDELKLLLKGVGFDGEIISKTPFLNFKTHESIKYNYSVPRGCEIKAWLELNKDLLGQKMSKTNYVILDDDSDILYWQRDKFIHIDSKVGLTSKNIQDAVNILNTNL